MKMPIHARKIIALILSILILSSGWPFVLLQRHFDDLNVVDNSIFGLHEAAAAPKTKTVVWYVGANNGINAVTSNTTTSFNFTINIPDLVPSSQPIRSAYILWNAHWQNTGTALSGSAFTIAKRGDSPTALSSTASLGQSGENKEFAFRLDATAAMQSIIGSASGSYALIFTSNITGPQHINESAELFITYDYDPFAPTQVNTVYQFAYEQVATATLGVNAAVTSPTFNFSLPESSATTTVTAGASSTNQMWIEMRGRISGSGTTVASTTLAFHWDAEASTSASFTQSGDSLGFLVLAQPTTAGSSPSSNHTFRIGNGATGVAVSAVNAIAVATYTFDFNASTKFRRTLQVLLTQSALTANSSQINTTTTINIPETSPSSTSAFLVGRSVFTTAANPGINATTTAATCAFPATTPIVQQLAAGETVGYPTIAWDVSTNLKFNTSGNKIVCSDFTTSVAANIRGLMLFWNYDYAKATSSGSRFNQNVSYWAGMGLTSGTATTSNTFDASGADASSTSQLNWLNAAFDNNSTAASTFTIGTNGGATAYAYLSTGENIFGEAFTTSTQTGLSTAVTANLQCSGSCQPNAAYNDWFQTEIVAADMTQAHYHWRNDDGSESGATQAANEDASTTVLSTGQNIRLRVEVTNAGDVTSAAAGLRLEYQKNATTGAWTQLATTSVGSAAWQMATSSQVSDGTATTNIATSTGGTTDANITFIAGTVVATTSRNQAANVTLTGLQFTEMEYDIKPTTNASTGVDYYFRVTNAGTALDTYSVFPDVVVQPSNPSVTNVVLNGGNDITLVPNATTTISVIASTTDPGGPGNIRYATGTIYRTSLGSNCSADNADCYQIASSSCSFSGSTSTVTCSAGIYYFAQSTGNPSSTFPSDSWTGAITVTNGGGTTATGTSTAVNVSILTALNVVQASINYGSVVANGNTGTVNQTTTVQNAGNSSSTVQVSGTILTNGSFNMPTSSQHYATSSFTFGTGDQSLNGSATTISGFTLRAPTSTNAIQGNVLWGVQVPGGFPTGTYNGTTTFTASFSS